MGLREVNILRERMAPAGFDRSQGKPRLRRRDGRAERPSSVAAHPRLLTVASTFPDGVFSTLRANANRTRDDTMPTPMEACRTWDVVA